jgi:hypothetical protein
MHRLHVTQRESWTQHLPQNPAQIQSLNEDLIIKKTGEGKRKYLDVVLQVGQIFWNGPIFVVCQGDFQVVQFRGKTQINC